jgi:hypothetical protein
MKVGTKAEPTTTVTKTVYCKRSMMPYASESINCRVNLLRNHLEIISKSHGLLVLLKFLHATRSLNPALTKTTANKRWSVSR